MLQTYSNSPYQVSKNLQRFSKKPWKSKQGVQQQQPNQRLQQPPKNGRGINNHNTTRETELYEGRYNHYFKVPTRDIQNFRERNLKTI